MRRKAIINTIYFCIYCVVCTVFLPAVSWGTGMSLLEKKPGKISFLYGDREVSPEGKGMKRDWGFVALVRFDDKVILFNAGGDPETLKHNMKVANVKPSEIDILVISHEHWDMYGGAKYILKENPKITVYATPKVKEILMQENEKWGDNVQFVKKTVRITPNMFVHEMKSMPRHGGRFGILTIGLTLKTEDGIVVLGSCGHVNIVDMLKASSHIAHESIIHMYVGGTHLLYPGRVVDLPAGGGQYTIPQDFRYSGEYVLKLISKLHELGLEKIVPTHCTGDRAEELFKQDFKDGYIKQMLGMTLKIAAPIR